MSLAEDLGTGKPKVRLESKATQRVRVVSRGTVLIAVAGISKIDAFP